MFAFRSLQACSSPSVFSVTAQKHFIAGLPESDHLCPQHYVTTLAYRAISLPGLEVHLTAWILCVPLDVTCGPVDTQKLRLSHSRDSVGLPEPEEAGECQNAVELVWLHFLETEVK